MEYLSVTGFLLLCFAVCGQGISRSKICKEGGWFVVVIPHLCINSPYVDHKRYGTDCSSLNSYNVLNGMLTKDTCMTAEKVFRYFGHLTRDNAHCRTDLENKFAAKYGPDATTPSHCHCTGANVLYDDSGFESSHAFQSCKDDSHFMSLYDRFYRRGEHTHASACQTHHTVWYDLCHTGFHSGCQLQLVDHLANTFGRHPDPCTCVESTSHAPVTTDAPSPSVSTASTNNAIPASCHAVPDMLVLHFLTTVDSCVSIHKLWFRLAAVQKTHPECMGIVRTLAHHYGTPKTTSCACYGSVSAPNPFKATTHIQTYSRCSEDPHYRALEQFLFEGPHACIDHKLIWTQLHAISQHCRSDFILTAASKFSEMSSDSCYCSPSSNVTAPIIEIPTTHGTKPTTTATTTKRPMTTTTATTTPTPTSAQTTVKSSTTKPYILKNYHCSKFATVQAVANHVVVNFDNVSACDKGYSNDGFVLTECNVTKNTADWHRGLQVKSACHDIPLYTPVAVFHKHLDTYNPAGAQSGVFAGCLEKGFRLLVEHCDELGPVIVHIDGGVFLADPSNYYVIS